MAKEPHQPVMFEFNAVLQVYGAKTLQEAEKIAGDYVVASHKLGGGPDVRPLRVNTDTYPEIFKLDPDDESIIEDVPFHEIERYDETENKWRDDD